MWNAIYLQYFKVSKVFFIVLHAFKVSMEWVCVWLYLTGIQSDSNPGYTISGGWKLFCNLSAMSGLS